MQQQLERSQTAAAYLGLVLVRLTGELVVNCWPDGELCEVW